MGIGKIFGAIVLVIAKIFATPPIADATGRVFGALMNAEPRPITEDEANTYRTVGRVSVVFPKRSVLTQGTYSWSAEVRDSSMRCSLRVESPRRQKDQEHYFRSYRPNAEGKRLDSVSGLPAVVFRSRNTYFVVHELLIITEGRIYILTVTVDELHEQREQKRLLEVFSSVRVH